MRWGGAGLIAAVLALAGCKSTDPKAADKTDRNAGGLASRPKGTGSGPAWLDEQMARLPGAGTGVPKAGSWADPKGQNFDSARESRGLLAGRVLDPWGQPAKNVFIRIEPVDASPKEKGGAVVGILTDANGYFMAKDLAPGRVYTLTAEAKAKEGGKQLTGVTQTRPPQPNLTISLRDDLGLPPPATPDATAGASNPGPSAGDTFPPPPAGLIPPTGVPAPSPAPARPSDGSWSPGSGATTAPIPPTITPTSPGAAAPAAPSLPAPAPVVNPERTAEAQPPFKPALLTIPGGPPVPTLPLPPTTTSPTPGVPPPGPRSARPMRPGANFALVDTLERPWDFATSGRAGGPLLLLDFVTTSCVHCKRTIPVLADLQARHAANGLQLIGVLCDDAPQHDRAAAAAKYQQENGLNYAVYVEPGPEPGAVRDKFRVQSYPTVVLLNGEGTVLWQGHPGKTAELESAIRRNLGK